MFASGLETVELPELLGADETVLTREAFTRWILASVPVAAIAKIVAEERKMRRRFTESSEAEIHRKVNSWKEYHRLNEVAGGQEGRDSSRGRLRFGMPRIPKGLREVVGREEGGKEGK
jgi:hypothetical protein